ncbi:hypothetical protein CEXT_380761 [Caerostris extrusa]|uniref:Uncharacterized protein n=1 Tax=Caerostris extrusa TaxID=172846 RepID=A0AAV4TTQ5_CAEEX|nr:hypothetical protein CEXT_380761 [Caerostris extrusa]
MLLFSASTFSLERQTEDMEMRGRQKGFPIVYKHGWTRLQSGTNLMSIFDGIPNELSAVNRRNVFPERSCCPVGTTLHLGVRAINTNARNRQPLLDGFTRCPRELVGENGGIKNAASVCMGGFIRVRGKDQR